jgi:hypothetical protein
MAVGRARAALLLLLFAALSAAPAPPAASALGPTHTTYLPLVRNGSGPRTRFGVEMTHVADARGLSNLRRQPTGWLRRNGLSWRDVEPMPGGAYRWDAASVRALEREMLAADQIDSPLILVVRGSPAWATAPYASACAPISPASYDAFARFLSAAVARYSRPPYNLRYWEIGNEPDAPVTTANQPYGCWGQPDDEFYGGRAYGELLMRAYPALKAANSQAMLLHGGLLLDQPYNAQTGAGRSARFLEGVLAAGAGGSFDLLSFHSYSYYNGTPDGTLGAVDWKPAYLRKLLGRYGLSKPLLNTESALLCLPASAACTSAQSYALIRMYVRAAKDDLAGFIWYIYDSDSFRSTAMVEPADPTTLRPSYLAYVQMHAMLAGASYLGASAGLPSGVSGHRFGSGALRRVVIWANQPTTIRLALGKARGLACSEWDGAALACALAADGSLTIAAVPGPRYISYTAP